jgi:hypothetical protein
MPVMDTGTVAKMSSEHARAEGAARREPSWSFFVATWSRSAVGAAVALALCAALLAFHAQQAFLEAAARDLPDVLGGLP